MLKKAADNNANLLLNFGPKSDASILEDINREFRALAEGIRKDGYPPLNQETWKEKRMGESTITKLLKRPGNRIMSGFSSFVSLSSFD